MLTGEQIKALQIVERGSAENYRATGYDFSAGIIIKPGGERVNSYTIPPQGIVEIISRERVNIPSNITGVATVKTGLSTQGLLALNIGIIDPCYKGPVSTFLVNFSKLDFRVYCGQVFLRSYYTKLDKETALARPEFQNNEEYIREKEARMVARFGETFLNVEDIVDNIIKENRLRLFSYIGSAAILITFCSLLFSMGVIAVVSRFAFSQ
ncbi:MAG: hypothetical protein V2I43_02235 [Parvularcula sp.]|jgi:deoxycytidine triphosphate deaminase|nr:hypothetical protein [Parvularcula sp.]